MGIPQIFILNVTTTPLAMPLPFLATNDTGAHGGVSRLIAPSFACQAKIAETGAWIVIFRLNFFLIIKFKSFYRKGLAVINEKEKKKWPAVFATKTAGLLHLEEPA